MRKDIDERKDWIISRLEEGVPRFEICRELHCKYDTLVSRLKNWGYSELKNPSGKGRPKTNCRTHVSEYLGREGKPTNSHRLKLKLVRDGIKEYKCEECGITEWRGKPIPLELDHLNGDHFDNELENLSIKCPNCHSQSEFNAGKNIGKGSKL